MRLLFTFVGGLGHFEPLVPFARAAAAAGHTVAVSGQASMVPIIERAGFVGFPSGPSFSGHGHRSSLREPDVEREERDLRDGFADRGARGRAADLLAICETWRPDLIVCDEADFGSMIAAECLGLPHATVLVTAAGSFVRAAVVADTLNRVRVEHGLPPDPELAMPARHLVLSPFPPSFRDPAVPLPGNAYSVRPGLLDPGSHDEAPPWIRKDRDRPLVYVTLGTIFNLESGDLFDRVIGGVRDLPVDVLVTVGEHIDPADFGPQPVNVLIERFVPQATILPYCRLEVSHAGSGSLIGALAFGRPSVLLALGADQLANATRAVALGSARRLDPVRATPREIGEAISDVLGDGRYLHAAERMRDEIEALPRADTAIPRLEGLVRADGR